MDIVVIEFKTEYTPDGKAVDWVLTAPRGEAMEGCQTWHRINDIKPNGKEAGIILVARMARWDTLRPKYEAWKANTAIPEDGTPLAAWSGVSADQATFLKRMGIVTVEHVRDMTDATIAKIPFPDARKLPGLARNFLEATDTAQKDRKIADMQERMEALEALLAEQMEGTHEAETEDKPRRGRPRKVAA